MTLLFPVWDRWNNNKHSIWNTNQKIDDFTISCCGLVASIPDCHPDSLGSIPSSGRSFWGKILSLFVFHHKAYPKITQPLPKVHFIWDFLYYSVGSYDFKQFKFRATGEPTRTSGGGRRKSKQNGRESARGAKFKLLKIVWTYHKVHYFSEKTDFSTNNVC